MAGKITPTVEQLRERLADVTDPQKYDDLVKEIAQTEKADTLRNATQRQLDLAAEARAKVERIKRHTDKRHDLTVRIPNRMAELNQQTFDDLVDLYLDLRELYNLSQAMPSEIKHANAEAHEVGMPPLPPFRDPTDWADHGTLKAFAAEFVIRFCENFAESEKLGATLKAEHMGTNTVNLHRVIKQ
jgi:hypothetical protein